MASAFVREKLKGQVVYFCCGSTVRWLFERGRVGHRRDPGVLSGFFGLQAPCPHIGIPAAVIFAGFDVYRNRIGSPFAEFGHVARLVEERDSDFA